MHPRLPRVRKLPFVLLLLHCRLPVRRAPSALRVVSGVSMQAALFAGFGFYRRVNKKSGIFWTYRTLVFFVFNSTFWSFLVTPARIRGAFFAVDLKP